MKDELFYSVDDDEKESEKCDKCFLQMMEMEEELKTLNEKVLKNEKILLATARLLIFSMLVIIVLFLGVLWYR